MASPVDTTYLSPSGQFVTGQSSATPFCSVSAMERNWKLGGLFGFVVLVVFFPPII